MTVHDMVSFSRKEIIIIHEGFGGSNGLSSLSMINRSIQTYI